MTPSHRVLRIHGGRLVNIEPRRALEEELDVQCAEGYEVIESFAVDDNVYLVLRNPG
ncbi:MAG: hypothetical protein ACRDYB_10580 [Acidimicrobiales bacterium]